MLKDGWDMKDLKVNDQVIGIQVFNRINKKDQWLIIWYERVRLEIFE